MYLPVLWWCELESRNGSSDSNNYSTRAGAQFWYGPRQLHDMQVSCGEMHHGVHKWGGERSHKVVLVFHDIAL
ncbi:hypothetical protein DPMN_163807 [Dreissena polymorpha]|uniref:Uncharacterized protein n=1 Tax=Dreissena polymorpha TaxID=45954 RepID=A0A9D4EUN1_DREPO|nr:hypothetical protein DPMN_163807 [Dreissena polymorpha]